jgi:hypothetical protein
MMMMMIIIIISNTITEDPKGICVHPLSKKYAAVENT